MESKNPTISSPHPSPLASIRLNPRFPLESIEKRRLKARNRNRNKAGTNQNRSN